MAKQKSSVSRKSSYEEIGEYWDRHDVADHWDKTEPVSFEVDVKGDVTLYPLPRDLSDRLRDRARSKGVDPKELLNTLLSESLAREGE